MIAHLSASALSSAALHQALQAAHARSSARLVWAAGPPAGAVSSGRRAPPRRLVVVARGLQRFGT